MHARRWVSLLTALFMIHFIMVDSDVACPAHGTEVAGQSDATAHGGDHHAAPADAAAAGSAERPCEIPARARCCQVLASCAMSLAVSRAIGGLRVGDLVRAVPAGASRAPLLQAAGPEPPPPRM